MHGRSPGGAGRSVGRASSAHALARALVGGGAGDSLKSGRGRDDDAAVAVPLGDALKDAGGKACTQRAGPEGPGVWADRAGSGVFRVKAQGCVQTVQAQGSFV
eukprot:358341-Chlamydomonas_euryale.AAC.9